MDRQILVEVQVATSVFFHIPSVLHFLVLFNYCLHFLFSSWYVRTI